jgi:hypothetical protein
MSIRSLFITTRWKLRPFRVIIDVIARHTANKAKIAAYSLGTCYGLTRGGSVLRYSSVAFSSRPIIMRNSTRDCGKKTIGIEDGFTGAQDSGPCAGRVLQQMRHDVVSYKETLQHHLDWVQFDYFVKISRPQSPASGMVPRVTHPWGSSQRRPPLSPSIRTHSLSSLVRS